MNHALKLQNKAFLEELFYLLAGFDTQNVYIADSQGTLVCSHYNVNYLLPFEFLIVKIREFYKLSQFDHFVQNYLRKLSILKNQVESIEELYVSLQDELRLFKDLERIYNVALKNSQNFPFSTNRKSMIGIDECLLKYFQEKESLVIQGCINRWINQGDSASLISIRNSDDFTSSQWENMFKIKQIGIGKSQLEGIETAGKIVFFIRMLFGIEIVNDKKNDEDENCKTACSQIKRKLPPKSPIKKANIKESMPIALTLENSYEKPNLYEENYDNGDFCPDVNRLQINEERFDETPILPYFEYKGDISPRRNELSMILSGIMAKQLSSELRLIQDLVFMQNAVFFNNMFAIFEQKLLTSDTMVYELNKYNKEQTFIESRVKIGHSIFENSEFILFEECESTLGDYVVKLLRYQRPAQENCFLINLQRLGISFKPGLLQCFIPRKTYFEMEIIFRFLFSINSSLYYLQKIKKYNFTRVIYLIFMKIKSESIDLLGEFFNREFVSRRPTERKECHFLPFENHGFNIDLFPQDFSSIISKILSKFFITTPEVFSVWTRLFDISLEYLQIEYKEHILESQYDQQVRECVNSLLEQITRHYGECEFTEFLKNLSIEKYL